MFETTIAGSLPKPSWLAEPEKLWAPWKLEGAALEEGKRDAALVWIKEQEDAGINIVTEGEQFRIHFVHGFVEHVQGIDWQKKTRMGIRNNRYVVDVPTVTGHAQPAASGTPRGGHLCPGAYDPETEVHPARADDDLRHGRGRALRAPRRHGYGVCRSAEPGGA